MGSQKENTGTNIPKELRPSMPRTAVQRTVGIEDSTCKKGADGRSKDGMFHSIPGLYSPEVSSPCPPRSDNQKYLQTLPNVPEGKHHTQLKTTV